MAIPSVLIVPDRYKSGVLYSQIPDSGAVDFDVTRATDAYRTNASGILESVASGVPRLDYPAAGGCPSLLVEPAATNLVLRSEEFDNASWIKTAAAAVTANTNTAPNNTLSADTLSDTITVANATYAAQQLVNFTSGTVYTASVYAKNINRRYIYIRFPSEGFTSNLFAFFDLQLGVVVTQSSAVTARIEIAPNGFYRCIATATATTTATASLFIGLSLTGLSNVYINPSVGSAIIWGAQLETGSVATSYIPTVAATATRNADVISKTGVSGFIGQLEGYLYAEVDISRQNFNTFLSISDGTLNNRIQILFTNATTFRALIRVSNVEENYQVTIPSIPFTGGIFKIALGYKANDYCLALNGTTYADTSSRPVPACNQIRLGANAFGDVIFNDRIRAAAIGMTRISNAELAALTTL
jgi:hypothetical protein